jgi:8-oxo-dGTP pyrophosphatase MutT (NUDIX family)
MLYRPGHWDLPGGHLALHEDIHECLHREIAEETGFDVELGPLLGLNKAHDGPYVQMIFGCRPKSLLRELRLQPQEHDAAQWLTVEQMRRLSRLIPIYPRFSAAACSIVSTSERAKALKGAAPLRAQSGRMSQVSAQ